MNLISNRKNAMNLFTQCTQFTHEKLRDEGVKQLRVFLKNLKAKNLIDKFEVTKVKAVKSPYGNKFNVKIFRSLPQRNLLGSCSLNTALEIFLPGEIRVSNVIANNKARQQPTYTRTAYVRTAFFEHPEKSKTRDPEARIPSADKALSLLYKMSAQERFSEAQGVSVSGITTQVRHIAKNYL